MSEKETVSEEKPLSIDERISELEKDVNVLQNKGKDKWDIFQIVASLLIPASITFVGYFYTSSMAKATRESNENIADKQLSLNFRIAKANLVPAFMDSLASNDVQRKRLAMRAVVIALPEDGPILVRTLSEDGGDQKVAELATEALKDRCTALIDQLFDEKKSVRISAAEDLISGWQKDPELAVKLLNHADQNKQNLDGIVNTLVVLDALDVGMLKPAKDKLEQFFKDVESNGPSTKDWVDKLRKKIATG